MVMFTFIYCQYNKDSRTFYRIKMHQIRAEKFKYKDLKIEILYFNYSICELATWPSLKKHFPQEPSLNVENKPVIEY